MPARIASPNPPDLEQARRRLARWRQGRSRGTPIPEELWVLATTMAREHGLACSARPGAGLLQARQARTRHPVRGGCQRTGDVHGTRGTHPGGRSGVLPD